MHICCYKGTKVERVAQIGKSTNPAKNQNLHTPKELHRDPEPSLFKEALTWQGS